MKDDNKDFISLKKRLEELNRYKLFIHIDEEKTYSDGRKVETVAMWMEFGSDEFNVHYPARPFFRSTFDANLSKIQRVYQAQLLKIIDGSMTPKQGLENVGKYVVERVKEMIVKGQYDGLAMSTVNNKGSDEPLIDTKTLYNSIRYKVE